LPCGFRQASQQGRNARRGRERGEFPAGPRACRAGARSAKAGV
jgi:hypothetical protein